MKVSVSRRYILLMAFIAILAVIYTGGLAMAHPFQPIQKKVLPDTARVTKMGEQIPERSIISGRLHGSESLDFSLTATGRSQFQLTFENPYRYPVKIRIYNIIGNLVAFEEAPAGALFFKTYNFSEEKMRLFVVEIGNQKHNLTKKVTTI